MNRISRSEHKALGYHQAVADALSKCPELRAVALQRLDWLCDKNPSGTPYYDEWRRLLLGPLNELIVTLKNASPSCCALRQESPFGDILTQRERAAIYLQVARRLDAAAA